MLARDSKKLEALRAIKSALLLLKTEKGKPDAGITQEQEIQLLKKLVKQREESAKVFYDNGRSELAKSEEYQASVIKKYLPEAMDEKEIDNIIAEVIKETGAGSLRDMGKVIAVVIERTQGRADNKTIANKVKHILSS